MAVAEILVSVPVVYRREWPDGYGARGWKLEAAIDDPEIIASTSEPGRRINTSVLIHDVLDHSLCGLPPSGHRNEAIALHQLSLRTGADPMPDLLQMVDEDLLYGNVIGESMRDFLPDDLRAHVPTDMTNGREIANYLARLLGREELRQKLADHLRSVGETGANAASENYRRTGLDYVQREPLGLAMQSLLARIDAIALEDAWEEAQGMFLLADGYCASRIDSPQPLFLEAAYF